ncbi:MAG: hypothetical protein K6A37_09385 [Saccharofermentans sp.]|nr:hypothetical protein [Saccharofermentans sp.]
MRRDYFICVFLLCICVSLFYVCFLPLYFVYGEIVPREFGPVETAFSWIYLVLVFAVLPIYAAYKKKFWMSAGLAAYGVVAAFPVWVLPGMADKLSGEDASIVSVVWAFLLKSIYGMAEAPFAPITKVLGDTFVETLPRRIMPVALILYVGCQVFRFYRNAYRQEQLDPLKALDKTSIENNTTGIGSKSVRKASMPEVLGTVITAPAPAPSAPSAPEESKETSLPE